MKSIHCPGGLSAKTRALCVRDFCYSKAHRAFVFFQLESFGVTEAESQI